MRWSSVIRARRLARTVVAALLALSLLAVPTGAAARASIGNTFDLGYCTWLAAEEGFKAWGLWVPWRGDAGDWASGALASGWNVSTAPEVDTILGMPRYVQGSGAYGHVGWVIGVDPDGSAVTVRSMNWRGWGVITIHRVAVDGRVLFLRPPAADALPSAAAS